MSIEIIPHRHSWKADFRKLAESIRHIVGDTAIRIDHIGSTAVSGLAAKDRIDIQITIKSVHDFAELESRLTRGGFIRAEHVTEDHTPSGCESDPGQWQKQLYRAPENTRPMNLHVRVAGKSNQRYPILFRDFLRSDKATADLYGQVKQQLALHCDEVDTYCTIKDPVCDLIMLSAENWALKNDWSLPPTDA